MRSLALLLVLLASPHAALAAPQGAPSPSAQCRAAIGAAERAANLPDRLLTAIGLVESGRRDRAGGVSPWPWTINAEGTGRFFQTRADAVEAAQALLDRGVRSIDVGCMQVNLLHHPNAFRSLDQAFDPAINARYAARFLTSLYAQTGAWPRAVAGYHSLTPEIGETYARKVLAVWPRERGGAPGEIEAEMARALAATGTRNGPLPPGPVTVTMAGGATARVMVLPDTLSGQRAGGRVAVQLMPVRRF